MSLADDPVEAFRTFQPVAGSYLHCRRLWSDDVIEYGAVWCSMVQCEWQVGPCLHCRRLWSAPNTVNMERISARMEQCQRTTRCRDIATDTKDRERERGWREREREKKKKKKKAVERSRKKKLLGLLR